MLKRTVTENALIKRLNRKLYADDRVVRKMRESGRGYRADCYRILDWRTNLPAMENLTLQELEIVAREEGCLAEWETVADEAVTA
jgi:hypothetical protein